MVQSYFNDYNPNRARKQYFSAWKNNNMIKACKKYLTAFKTGIDHLEVVFLSYTYTYTYLRIWCW